MRPQTEQTAIRIGPDMDLTGPGVVGGNRFRNRSVGRLSNRLLQRLAEHRLRGLSEERAPGRAGMGDAHRIRQSSHRRALRLDGAGRVDGLPFTERKIRLAAYAHAGRSGSGSSVGETLDVGPAGTTAAG